MGRVVSKALIALGKALDTPNRNNHHNGHHHGQVYRAKQQEPPFHWHWTLFGKTKYVMRKIGYNQRTGKYVYQCPFDAGFGRKCGKAERPY